MNAQTKITNLLTGAVALLTLGIGAGAFVLSYDSLYATGQTYGIPAAKAWIWPLLIDGPLVVFTIALLVSQLTRAGIRLWAGLVILYTLATIGFNWSHAQPSPMGWTVATVAPMGLLLTTEALRHLAKGIIERAAAVQTLAELLDQIDQQRRALAELLSQKQGEFDRLQGQIDQASAKLEAIKGDIKACQIEQKHRSGNELTAAKLAKIAQRRDKVLSLLSEGMTPADIAGELEVTIRTIKRDITALNGAAAAVGGMTQ